MMVDRTLEYELNQLIRLMHDSVEGYAKAAELTQSEEYRALFTRLGKHREQFVEELSSLENVVGGEPVEEGNLGAALYRTLKELNVSVVSDKDKVILNAVRDVLGATIKHYETLLANQLTVPAGIVRNTIEKQHRALQETQTEINSLIDRHGSG